MISTLVIADLVKDLFLLIQLCVSQVVVICKSYAHFGNRIVGHVSLLQIGSRNRWVDTHHIV